MTLNLILTSQEAVYLSGDFRLTSLQGNTVVKSEDDFSVQKIVPVINRKWSALVAWTGIAHTPSGEGIGDWLARAVQTMDIHASFDELPKRLLAANDWLMDCACKDLAFSVVGFIGGKPLAMIVSNMLGFDGTIYNPRRPRLEIIEKRKPTTPQVFTAGESHAVTPRMIAELKNLLIRRQKPKDGHELLGRKMGEIAAINVAASKQAPLKTISEACVVGALLPTGDGGAVPYGVPDSVDYVPQFVRRFFLTLGNKGFRRKLGLDGKPLPCRWVQMTWKTRERPFWLVMTGFEMQADRPFPPMRERGFRGFLLHNCHMLAQSLRRGPKPGDSRYYWF